MYRYLRSAVLMASLTTMASGPVAAQGDATDAVGFGGRVEVPEAGYVLTLPDDWVYIRPTAEDTSSIIETVRTFAPDLASMVEAGLARGANVSLIAVSPAGPDAAFTATCNVIDSPSDGLSLDLRIAAELASYRSLGDAITVGPDVTTLDLPAGKTVRLDVGLSVPGYETASSSYVYTDGTTFHTLTCTDLDWPEDRWLSIGGTFEFLPESL
jgi:hypothetical protein